MKVPSAEEYLADAERESRRATRSLEDGDYEYACFHSQQCAEMALKAFLVKHGNYLCVHSLSALYERARSKFGLELSVRPEDLEELSLHYTAARYRNARLRAGIAYDKRVAERCLSLGKMVLESVKEALRCP